MALPSETAEASKSPAQKSVTQRILDTVERVGNAVPHPVAIFLISSP